MRIVRVLMVVAIVFLLIAFGFSKKTWDEKIGQHAQKASVHTVNKVAEAESSAEKEEVETVADDSEETETSDVKDEEAEASEPTEEKVEEKSEFYTLLADQKISSIKLLGDGITAGYGHSAYLAPDGGRIIFSGNGETFREAGNEFGSWANELRNYVDKSEFGNIEVVNAGIRDKTADWAYRNLDGLLKPEEEAVIVMIGTDDRIFSSLEAYKATMRNLLAEVDKRSEYMVVMSPPPSKEDLKPYKFTMEEIDGVLKKLSEENGYLFVSQFDAFQEQLANGVAYESLMQTESSNPQNGGYELIWQTMQEELGLE